MKTGILLLIAGFYSVFSVGYELRCGEVGGDQQHLHVVIDETSMKLDAVGTVGSNPWLAIPYLKDGRIPMEVMDRSYGMVRVESTVPLNDGAASVNWTANAKELELFYAGTKWNTPRRKYSSVKATAKVTFWHWGQTKYSFEVPVSFFQLVNYREEVKTKIAVDTSSTIHNYLALQMGGLAPGLVPMQIFEVCSATN